MAKGWEEKEGVRLIKCYSYPISFPTTGPASLLPAPCPALHLAPRAQTCLFPLPGAASEELGVAEKGEKGLKRSPSLAESGGGASVFNLEPTLECRDPQVTDGKTKAQRGLKTCPKFVRYGSDRLGIRIQFFIMPATFSQNFKEIVITQSGILLSEIVMSIEQLIAASFVVGENYDQSKSQ